MTCRPSEPPLGSGPPIERSGAGGRSSVVIASVAMRRNSSNDITGISMWPCSMIVGVPSWTWTAMTSRGAVLPMNPTNE